LLEKHLARLAASASYFGFEQDERAWRSAALAGLAALAGKEMHRQRIRLELSPDGAFSFASRPFRPERREWRVILARDPVASQDVSLFHKTTNRAVYDAALAAARAAGADEAILWNERGELTEGTRTNLVLELGGERLTPARTCGLLGGVFRQELLERGKIREALLTREDLLRAERVLLVNALRGWIPAGLA
jgi:branched-subunit amino acid aminotransferase/4-amino-4-deoxychorismate lyase